MNAAFPKLKRALLIGGDICILYLALWTTLSIRFGNPIETGAWQEHIVPFSFLYAVWILTFYAFGLYDMRIAKNNSNFYITLAKVLAVTLGIAIIFFYFTPFFGIAPKTNLLLVTAFVFLLLTFWRHLYNLIVKYPLAPDHIAIIGRDTQVFELEKYFKTNPQLGYHTVSIIEPTADAFMLLTRSAHKIHRIVIAFPIHLHIEFVKFLFGYADQFTFEHFFSLYERITGKIPVSQIDEIWFLNNLREGERNLYEVAKRVFDITVSLTLVSFTIILLPFVALAIKLDSPGPLLYSQERVGKNGRVFRLLKFRSMVSHAEKNGAVWAQKNDPRVTRVGNILRKTFIDELPQCINILRGEMSFIGPRPERPEFITQLTKKIPFYQIRHLVKPGITGWAQVNFPYGNSTQDALEKLQYDLYYIKNRSLILDLKILLKTVNVISKGGTQ